MTHLLNFIAPTALDVVVTPWEYFVDALPALLLIGALIAIVVTVTVLLIRRFFGKKRK
jgi:hypothetical protein